MLSFLSLLSFILFALVCWAFWVTRTSKQLPKSWYEWNMEFKYQQMGIAALIHDYLYRSFNKVELYKQPGRVAVITGGNRGIGLRIVEKLLQCDMTVIMGVRDPKVAEDAVKKLVSFDICKGKLLCLELDVGNLKSVENFAKAVKESFQEIHVLINNAGIMFAPYNLTEDGFELHFATNYLGHFLLQYLLFDELKAGGLSGRNARIVNVSSCAHLLGRINYKNMQGMKKYNCGAAYAQSKLAQIMAGHHLQKLIDQNGYHIQIISVHPGIVDTDLFEYSATTAVPALKQLFFKTPEQGSRTPVYAAISPDIEGLHAIYLSNCYSGKLHPVTLNANACEQLFTYTCNMLKINFFKS